MSNPGDPRTTGPGHGRNDLPSPFVTTWDGVSRKRAKGCGAVGPFLLKHRWKFPLLKKTMLDSVLG